MTPTRRVLLATPIKDGFDHQYLNGIVGTLMSGHEGVEYIPVVTESTYVNYARNSLADKARANRCDDLLFVDSDMKWSAGMVRRILSHDVDIVGGRYCKRKDGEPEWLYTAKDGCTVQEDGLLEVNAVATGFMRIRTKVFDWMFNHFHERRYQDRPGEGEVRCEYFPIGMVGGGSYERRVELLKNMIDPDGTIAGDQLDIARALYGDLGPGWIQGEDYAFCRLARKAGFKVYVDTKLTVRHLGLCPYPRDEFMRPYVDGEVAT